MFYIPIKAYSGEVQNLAFQLEVFPNGEEGEDNSDYVAVFLTSRRQEDLDVRWVENFKISPSHLYYINMPYQYGMKNFDVGLPE